MTRRTLILLSAAVAAASGAIGITGGLLGMAAPPWAATRAAPAGWQEVGWPHPRDAWPAGRAFRCGSPDCGGGIELTVRPKIGFCNCTTGVTDDVEVDAVSDLDLVSADFRPAKPGESVTIGGMPGLTRSYTLHMPDGSVRLGAGFAVSRRCDLVVGASHGPGAGSAEAQRAIAELLGSEPVLAWLGSFMGKG